MKTFFIAALIGVIATICIDVWSLFLRRAFGIRSLDYCLLGRWALHIPAGRWAHERIAASPAKRHECQVGWAVHYGIGIGLALMFVGVVSSHWVEGPTLLPALTFGLVTVVMPFFVLQPAIGLGIASSRAPSPAAARLKSIATHTVFGAGLYLAAELIRHATDRG
jgi:hypothetical protein